MEAKHKMTPPTCPWATSHPLMAEYHDRQWGVPVHDDKILFEFLILESAQAGLSWLTILKRRENYRKAFSGFDPEAVAQYTDADRDRLLADPGIIRNRLKIDSAIQNAAAFLDIARRHGSFSRYIWTFVDNRPMVNHWQRQEEMPAQTEVSVKMSRALKKEGFSFVGPVICYSFMQAVGLVNDHLVSCLRHRELAGGLEKNR